MSLFDLSAVFLDDRKLLEVISEGSLKFEEWTSLISLTEKTHSDDMEKISLVYDPFLSEYPLCYVYWRKYVNHTIKLCTTEKAVKVFERAVESATYCVDVWVDYCTFGCLAFGDPADARRLFKRAMTFVGKDYLCHTLWDKYIEFEFSQQQWSSLAEIYIQALMFPTKKLHKYYDSFNELVGVLKDEMGVQSKSTLEEPGEPVLNGDISTSYKLDKVSGIIRDLLDPSSASVGLKALQEYTAIGEYFYRNSCLLNEKISSFEAHINRSYFHVKPLEVSQLENWHQYLDFAESHGDFDWAFKLYERCLIPCAIYPEVWVRYVEFMEGKGGRELADFALSRATKTFVKSISVMHLCNAWFKEHLGDVKNARAAFLDCNVESDSDFVESVIRKANMEKRLGNFKAAARTCKQALKVAVAMGKHDVLPLLYIHFSRLKYEMADSEDAAIGILTDAIKKIPTSKLLIEELIKFAMAHRGSRHVNVVNSIVAKSLSLSTSSSKGLSPQDGEDISKLYLEFVDLCGTIRDVRQAWTRHVKLFPHLLRNLPFRVANGRQWKMSPPQITVKDNLLRRDSDNQAQPSSPEDRPSSLENHNVEAMPDQVPEPQSPLQINHEMIVDEEDNALPTNDSASSDQVAAELLQSGATDTTMQEEVPREVKDDAPEQYQSVDLASAEAPPQFSKENAEKQESSRDPPEKDLNPLQLEKLSLEPRRTQSPGALDPDPEVPKSSDLILPTSDDCRASEELNKIMPVTGEDAGADIRDLSSSPVSTNAAVSAHVDNSNRSPSSSAGDHNSATDSARPRSMSDRRRHWHRERNEPEIHRSDSRSRHRDRSQGRTDTRGSPRRRYAEVEADPQSSRQMANPSQDPTSGEILPGQSDTSQHPQQSPAQQENAQNSHSYEQMWQQYYYYYQQQLLWLQQQLQEPQNQDPQQQVYLQQQYQYQLQQYQYLQQQQYQYQMHMQQSYQSQHQQQPLENQQYQHYSYQQPQGETRPPSNNTPHPQNSSMAEQQSYQSQHQQQPFENQQYQHYSYQQLQIGTCPPSNDTSNPQNSSMAGQQSYQSQQPPFDLRQFQQQQQNQLYSYQQLQPQPPGQQQQQQYQERGETCPASNCTSQPDLSSQQHPTVVPSQSEDRDKQTMTMKP
ncbi:Pre-mRNA-processing factor 39-2 [Linum perenne]